MKKYNHKNIEKKVQKYWDKNKIFKTKINIKKKKYYCLCMIPYPSGNLHMGHVRNYTLGDIISRYQRLNNKNVLHPIGWDSFGLPAENAALENKLSPNKWTKKNIKYMKKQLKTLGISYDWDKEINTCKSEFYKWEQWLFIQLFKKKLIYKKKDIVNWCPKDMTTLANEQVINNKCWRCNTIVKKKKISQWFIKITKYANKLYNDLKILNKWPIKVIKMQKKWIGKTKGIEIKIKIFNTNKYLKIFTSKYKILKLNKIICISISIRDKIINYIKKKNINIIKEFNKKNENNNIKKKKYIGINTNLYAINPINDQIIPIWITNFTEEQYNTNSIFIFKKEKYHKFIKTNKIKYKINNIKKKNIKKIKSLIKNKIIKKKNNFKIKDWAISRQRYWGVPIPIFKIKNKYILFDENKLPIKLPKIKNNNFSINYLKKNQKWKFEKINNKKIIKETDTLDTFMESSWYYLRYVSNKNNSHIFDKKKANYWLPIDIYIGGIEHATMHLIYLRFMNKFIKNLGLIKYKEPVKKLICQGMVLSKTYYYTNNKKKKIWVSPLNIKKTYKNNKVKYYSKDKNIKVKYYGISKMSKSKNNGINPINIINKYGADTLRLFIIFSAPIEKNLIWKEKNIKGCYRFLNKLWNFVNKIININKYIKNKIEFKKEKFINIKYILNKTIEKVTNDIEKNNSYNTSISTIMNFFNIIKKKKIKNIEELNIIKLCINNIIILLYPFAPHITFYLWKIMKNSNNIDYVSWPKINNNLLNNKINIKIIVQINGKKKKILLIKNKISKIKILKIIINKKILNKKIKNKKIKKIIYIKNKIINFVI